MDTDKTGTQDPEPIRRRAYRPPAVVDFGDVERLTNAVSQPGTRAN